MLELEAPDCRASVGGIPYDTMVTWKIVVDTNVVVSGLRSRRGAAHRLLTLVGTGAFVHCLSVGLLFEYEAALGRPGAGIRLPRRALDDILDYLVATARQQQIYYLWRPILRDLSDDLVLEVAVAAGCDSIVTFNGKDFAGSERFGVRVMTPASFLAELERNR